MEASERVERPLDENGEVALRPVQPEDEDFLLSVYASTRAEEMALVNWDEAQRQAFLRMQFKAQFEQYHARFPDAAYSIILFRGARAGRFWVGRAPDQIRLLDIAILPQYQNRGIGSALLKDLIAEARETRRPLRHMVYKFNLAALRFYQRLGFSLLEEAGLYLHMELLPSAARLEAIPSRD